MEFSERVALSNFLPLASNATLNTSAASAMAQSGASSASSSGSGSSSAGYNAKQAGGVNVPLNASGNLIGATGKPFSFVNITDLNRQLSRPGLVTVMTVYMADGTTITSFNITNSTNANGGSNAQSNQGECFYAY
jgi:hypothetical protein